MKVLVTSLFCRKFNVNGFNITSMTQPNVFQLHQVTLFEKDEVLVTSLFCRMFNVNGFNITSMTLPNVFQLRRVTRFEKDEVLVTSLFCRMFNVNGFNTQVWRNQRISTQPTKKITPSFVICSNVWHSSYNWHFCTSRAYLKFSNISIKIMYIINKLF